MSTLLALESQMMLTYLSFHLLSLVDSAAADLIFLSGLLALVLTEPSRHFSNLESGFYWMIDFYCFYDARVQLSPALLAFSPLLVSL